MTYLACISCYPLQMHALKRRIAVATTGLDCRVKAFSIKLDLQLMSRQRCSAAQT